MFSFLRRVNMKSESLFLTAVYSTKVDLCPFPFHHILLKCRLRLSINNEKGADNFIINELSDIQ